MQDAPAEKFIIDGLGGKKTLSGSIRISGAKNAALKLMAASALFDGPITLTNVPKIEDVKRMEGILESSGAAVSFFGDNSLKIDPRKMRSGEMPEEISKRLRASIVATGPFLARFGSVSFPHPGGCVIGARPIDLFLLGFQKMGARVSVEKRGNKDAYVIRAGAGKLRGAEIFFKNQSVTATETFMMAAALAHGKTTIKNAAMEPEIAHLAEFLSRGGARIKGAGTTTIEVDGTGGEFLRAGGEPFAVMPDRIEAGSFLILGALAARELSITGCNPAHLESLIEILAEAGVQMKIGAAEITVRGKKIGIPKAYGAVSVKTHEYPGFPTDLQAPMVVFLTQAKGESTIFETIFEGRLSYAEQLSRMGASIEALDTHRVRVKGPSPLAGKILESPDLRAGLAFVIASIIAKGESVVHNVYNIDRGYEDLDGRLSKIGVSIRRVAA